MKKGAVNGLLFSLIIVFGFFALFNTVIVSAASSVGDIGNTVKNGISDAVNIIFSDLLSEYNTNTDIFFVKILLFILLYVMIQTAVRAIPRLGENKTVAVVISFIVAVLAVKWLSDDMVKTILLPYGVLGIALATLLPFLIFFYFVHATKMNGAGRRIAWIFFALSFVMLFYNRYDSIADTGKYFYYAVAGLIVIAFIFDRGIHQYFFMHELNMFYRGAKSKAVAALQAEYMNLIHIDTSAANERRKSIEESIKRLGGEMP